MVEHPKLNVSVRLAEQDGLIYLDLADEFWRCIEIGANGWRILDAAAWSTHAAACTPPAVAAHG